MSKRRPDDGDDDDGGQYTGSCYRNHIPTKIQKKRANAGNHSATTRLLLRCDDAETLGDAFYDLARSCDSSYGTTEDDQRRNAEGIVAAGGHTAIVSALRRMQEKKQQQQFSSSSCRLRRRHVDAQEMGFRALMAITGFDKESKNDIVRAGIIDVIAQLVKNKLSSMREHERRHDDDHDDDDDDGASLFPWLHRVVRFLRHLMDGSTDNKRRVVLKGNVVGDLLELVDDHQLWEQHHHNERELLRDVVRFVKLASSLPELRRPIINSGGCKYLSNVIIYNQTETVEGEARAAMKLLCS